MKRFVPFLLSLTFSISLSVINAQPGRYLNDVATPKSGLYVFTHVTLFTDYQTKIEDATLVIDHGKVVASGRNVTIPAGATEINMTGKYIYPSFIDIYSSYGMPELPKLGSQGNVYNSTKKGPYSWNEAIRPETDAAGTFSYKQKEAESMRNLGFGVVLSHNPDGIVRGTGALVSLGDGKENKLVLMAKSSQHFSFNRGSSSQDYPRSLMGTIALLRQTFYDQQWYEQAREKELDLSLEALSASKTLPRFFEANDKWNILRAAKIAKEFGQVYIMKGAGDEYQRLDAIKATGSALVLPLNFPAPYDLEDSFAALNISLRNLMHWEQAPSNPYRVSQAGIPFAFTLNGLSDKKEFWKNLQKAWQNGLSSVEILKALTYTPAKYIHAENIYGNLKVGSAANFFIADDSLMGEEFMINENWIKGEKYINTEKPKVDLTNLNGLYQVNGMHFPNARFIIKGAPEKTRVVLLDTKMSEEGRTYTISTDSMVKRNAATGKSYITFTKFDGATGNDMGLFLDTNAVTQAISITSMKIRDLKPSDTKPDSAKKAMKQKVVSYAMVSPFMEYGSGMSDMIEESMPKNVYIKNATIWTAEKEGVLEQADVLIKDGKIAAIGKNIPTLTSLTAIKYIDGTGLHVTPGIVDEHSHIACSGDVNEGTQSVTSEVRIGDIINPEDINIYRQLSGGVTSSHILHGSANCIGGQTQLLKLRWGSTAEEMKFEGWEGFIKFALGENVKQSNWGDRSVVRYPQTRMGVEQVMVDAFIRAKEYKKKWEVYKLSKGGEMPRRDLELDALVEILEDKRHITCHSYVQSEINMLMHVADSMGFKVNTFTHILEGYKVADKMKAHGAAGSTFADWWAYKYEVMEAIPYNAYLMNKVGITTSVNSDDAEMARRLNQEAAKSTKYGGMNDTDVIQLCTLNPAKMLHVDNRVGSLKVGKDADVVIWNGNPLSIYSKVLKTFVDGRCYYDAAEQDQMMMKMIAERSRIMNKMREAKKNGEKTGQAEVKQEEEYGCGH